MTMNQSKSAFIDPPDIKLFLKKPPLDIKDEVLLKVCQIDFRRAVYSLREKWDIPPKTGLTTKLVQSIEEIKCECVDVEKPGQNNSWIYRDYIKWHADHKEKIHNLEFQSDISELKKKHFPAEHPWYAIAYNIVLFNTVFHLPSPTEKVNGTIMLRIGDDSLPEMGLHPYDIKITTDDGTPRLEIIIYRDMKTADWEKLVKIARHRIEERLPSHTPTSNRRYIETYVKIADYKREGYSDDKILYLLGDAISKSTIRQYSRRAKELGL